MLRGLAVLAALAFVSAPAEAQHLREINRCIEGNTRLCYTAAAATPPSPLPETRADLHALSEPACTLGDESACILDALAVWFADGFAVSLERLTPFCDAGSAHACFVLGTGRVALGEAGGEALSRSCALGEDVACVMAVLTGSERLAERYAASAAMCEAGNGSACVHAGEAHMSGAGTTRDPAAALAAFERSCDLGDSWGCVRYGVAVSSVDGATPEAMALGRSLFERACTAGDWYGCFELGIALTRGEGGPVELERGNALVRDACEVGEADACVDLGYAYESGRGVDVDLAAATRLYARGCAWASATGCEYLGDFLATAVGTPLDLAGAMAAWERACALDERHGCARVRAHERVAAPAVDAVASVEADGDACSSDASACLRAADRLATGVGIARDVAAAAVLYGRACDRGVARACGALGALLVAGAGVAPDAARGETLRTFACEAGATWACGPFGGDLAATRVGPGW